MSAPKLFEFPDGTTIDLNYVYGVSRPYTVGSEYHVRLFFVHAPQQPEEFFLGADKGKAGEEKRALVARWAQDK